MPTDPFQDKADSNQTSRRVCVAKINTAHGVRGLVKIQCFAEDPESLHDYPAFHTAETGDHTLKLTLKNRLGKGNWVAAVEGVSDRDEALKLRNTSLYVERDDLPEAEEGQYYHVDLIGMKVQNVSGKDCGTLIAIDNFGAGDLLEIKPPRGAAYYLPFTNDFVPDIDLEAGLIIIDPPEGIES